MNHSRVPPLFGNLQLESMVSAAELHFLQVGLAHMTSAQRGVLVEIGQTVDL